MEYHKYFHMDPGLKNVVQLFKFYKRLKSSRNNSFRVPNVSALEISLYTEYSAFIQMAEREQKITNRQEKPLSVIGKNIK